MMNSTAGKKIVSHPVALKKKKKKKQAISRCNSQKRISKGPKAD